MKEERNLNQKGATEVFVYRNPHTHTHTHIHTHRLVIACSKYT